MGCSGVASFEKPSEHLYIYIVDTEIRELGGEKKTTSYCHNYDTNRLMSLFKKTNNEEMQLFDSR